MNFIYADTALSSTKNLVEKYNGTIESTMTIIKDSDIDWKSENFQTRQGTSDSGHVAALASDIETRGLQDLPTVEKIGDKYAILSGHHRFLAMRRNQSNLSPDQWKFPCTIVSFNSEIERQKYLQGSNDHMPVKGHSKKDAVRFIKKMRAAGYFDSCDGDVEQMKEETYLLLSEFYKRIATSSKLEVFNQGFDDLNLTRVKTIQKEDARILASDAWDKNSNLFSWDNDIFYCSAEYNNSKKVIVGALRKRVELIDQGKATRDKEGKVRLLTYFPSKSDVESLKNQREAALEEESMMNRLAWRGSPIIIEQICFAPQIDGVKEVCEKDCIIYNWNYADGTFVKA